jgi:hypothetical protein
MGNLRKIEKVLPANAARTDGAPSGPGPFPMQANNGKTIRIASNTVSTKATRPSVIHHPAHCVIQTQCKIFIANKEK